MLTLLLSACSVNPDNPDNEDPDINNPADPNEQPTLTLEKSDTIKDLAYTKVRYDAEPTRFGIINEFSQIANLESVQPYIDFVLKNYHTLNDILLDYPALVDTKDSIGDNTDRYTFSNESHIHVFRDGKITYFNPYFQIDTHVKSYEDDTQFYVDNQPYRFILFSTLLVLFDFQFNVKFAYKFENPLYQMKYGSYLDDN